MNCGSTSSSENVAGRLLHLRKNIGWILYLAPIETDPVMLLARRAARIRGAKDSGPKLLHKQLHDEHNRSTYYRRQRFSRSQIKRPIV